MYDTMSNLYQIELIKMIIPIYEDISKIIGNIMLNKTRINNIKNIDIIKYLCKNYTNLNLDTSELIITAIQENKTKDAINYIYNFNKKHVELIGLIINMIKEAVRYDRLEVVKCIFNQFGKMNYGEHLRWGEHLGWAAYHGHLHIVEYLHNNGVDLHYDNDDPLRYAAKNGHLHVVKYLHKNGADITAENNYAIINASCNGSIELISYLHKNGADITVDDNMPIYKAACGNNFDVVLYLHMNGASLNRINSELIVNNISKISVKLISYLETNNVDIYNVTDELLSRAAYCGRLDILKYLNENGADVSNPILMELAVRCGNFDMVKYLFSKGHKILNSYKIAIDNKQYDIVIYLHKKNPKKKHTKSLNILLKYLFKNNIVDTNGVSILDKFIKNKIYTKTEMIYAAKYGNLNIVQFLHGVKKCTSDIYNRAFEIASSYNNFNIVKYLHESCGVLVTNNAIIYAIKKNNLEIVKYLYNKVKLIVDDQLIKHLIVNNYLYMIKFLHKNGVNITIKNAIKLAAGAKNNFELIKYLHENNAPMTNDVLIQCVYNIEIIKYFSSNISKYYYLKMLLKIINDASGDINKNKFNDGFNVIKYINDGRYDIKNIDVSKIRIYIKKAIKYNKWDIVAYMAKYAE
jgi:hypothetical protein